MLARAIDDVLTGTEKHQRTLFAGLVVGVVLLAVGLRLLHLSDVPVRSPDERVYTHFALRVAADGLGAYRDIFQGYAADPGQGLYPSPTRLLHVLAFASVMKLTASTSAQAGAAVSLMFGVGSVLLLAAIGRRFMNRFVGVLAALFLAAYVVELEFARRAWGESTASFACALLFYATCALDEEPRRPRALLAFFGCGTACLLVKETSAMAYALCGAWLIIGRWRARDARSAAVLAAGGLLSAALALGVLVALAGELGAVVDGLWRGVSFGSNDWGAEHASGPWYQFPRVLVLIAPVMAVMAALGAAVIAIVPRSARVRQGLASSAPRAAGLALLLAGAFLAACSFGPDLQYLRMMAPAHSSYCLLAAIGVRSVLVESEDRLRGKLYPALLAALPVVFALALWRDHALYRDVVVRSGMQDLSARWILDGAERRGERAIDRAERALEASPAPAERRAPPGSNALDLSVAFCQRQRYADCVNAARAVLQVNARSAEAWNNAAAGYAGLGLWDDAMRCARQALELRPDFQLARNNLAWAIEQKAKQTAWAGR